MPFLLLLAALLPSCIKVVAFRRLLGWTIGKNVKIGFSYIHANSVVLADHVRIGHFNIIRNIKFLKIGENSYIANLNSFFGATYEGWDSHLEIGQSVNFMSHHFLDVGGKIMIGDHTVIAGRDSQLWGHGLVYDAFGSPSLKPLNVSIGSHVYIGARATLVGCSIPDRTVVGAGSVVTKQFAPEPCPYLIAGNPAIIKKRYQVSSPELSTHS
jgi:acetyltransferase-like isoleucine patch superfamily enzyme